MKDKAIRCPYCKGVKAEKRPFQILCGENDILSYSNEDNFHEKVSKVCKGDPTQCRTYCFRQLRTKGYYPQSFWKTEDATAMVQAIEKAVDACEGDILRYLDSTIG